MKNSRPQAIGQLLNASRGDSADIMRRARALQALTTTLRRALPSELAKHCQVANIRAGVLVLTTDSPAWSSRLHYLGPTLLEQLRREHGLKVNRLSVRVLPPRAETKQRPPRQIHLSPESAQAVKDTALSITDPQLRAALMRLARWAAPGQRTRSS